MITRPELLAFISESVEKLVTEYNENLKQKRETMILINFGTLIAYRDLYMKLTGEVKFKNEEAAIFKRQPIKR